jgi:hypothetical protein
MGKVSQKIKDIQALSNNGDLLRRFKKTLCAQAIREYLGMEVDNLLVVEINLLEDEVMNRLSKATPLVRCDLTKKT